MRQTRGLCDFVDPAVSRCQPTRWKTGQGSGNVGWAIEMERSLPVIKKITGRHMEVTDAIRSYVEKKLARLERYYDRISEMEVILDEEGNNHKIDIMVKADHRAPFVVHESGEDMYACLDSAVDKLERQLTRFKEKSRIHKGRKGAAEATAGMMDISETEEK